MSGKLKMGICGLGGRGGSLLCNIVLHHSGVEVTGLCDTYAPRLKSGAQAVFDATGRRPLVTDRYTDLIESRDVDALLIATSWEMHAEIACAAMRAGKITALEVGGAYSVEDCWELVRTYEQTRTPFMFLENCCYNRDELLATGLVRGGVLGEVVHCHGAYGHDLREEVAYGERNHHYRLRNYLNRNCDNYPTHELGPIAKLLNVNRGNRMVSLVSVASKACGLREYVKDREDLSWLRGQAFRQGDIVNTLITCEDGATISLRLDTTLPRVYDREFTVRGTKGLYMQTVNAVIEDGKYAEGTPLKQFYDSARAYEDRYLSSVWKNISEQELEAGHGGMDSIMFRRFVEAVNAGEEMPLDVYDAAAWMSVSSLSEQSVALKGHPVPIPDFTGGKWILRSPKDVVEF